MPPSPAARPPPGRWPRPAWTPAGWMTFRLWVQNCGPPAGSPSRPRAARGRDAGAGCSATSRGWADGSSAQCWGQVPRWPGGVSGSYPGIALRGGCLSTPAPGAGNTTGSGQVARALLPGRDSPGGVQEEEEDGRQDEVIAAHRPAPPEHHDPGHGWQLCGGSAGLALTS